MIAKRHEKRKRVKEKETQERQIQGRQIEMKKRKNERQRQNSQSFIFSPAVHDREEEQAGEQGRRLRQRCRDTGNHCSLSSRLF